MTDTSNNHSEAFEAAKAHFLQMSNQIDEDPTKPIEGLSDESKSFLRAIPEEERSDFSAFMVKETLARVKDILIYGINRSEDSEALQNAKRVFGDDINSKRPGPGMDDAARDALMQTLDKDDQAKFLVHILTTAAKSGIS